MKKSLVKRLLTLTLISAMAIGCLAGCGASKKEKDGAKSDKLNRIIEKGKITIGVNPPGEPICFYDDKGNLIGYDVDFAKKLAKEMGVKAELVEVNSENRISAVTSGRVDVIFANITGNLERAKSIDFSIPYLRTGIKMATRKGMDDVKVVADMNDSKYTFAVASGTTGEELVLKYAPKAKLVYTPSYPDQLLALQEGKCDAIFEDGTSIDYAAGQFDYLEAKAEVYTSDPICIGYAKGDADFGRYLDMFVSSMISSGYQKETYHKWFGTEYTGKLTAIW